MTSTFQGYRRVLVATDFSAHSDAARQQAIWLVRQAAKTHDDSASLLANR